MKNLITPLGNQSGLSLLEMLIASSIASITFIGLMSSSLFFKKKAIEMEVKYAARLHVFGIMEQIRSNLGVYQVMNTFDEGLIDTLLDVERLPMAWDSEKLVETKDCVNCPGRMGYLILPIEGMKGIYKVRFAVYHHSLSTETVNFEYFVSEK